MKTLKTFIFAALLLTAFALNAQEKKVIFGVKAGLNFANVTSDKGEFDNTSTKAGFHAGVTLDILVAKDIYLFTGVKYTSKGVKVDLATDQDITAAYVQLPVMVGYKFNVTQDLAILPALGPYFAYGVNGKIKQGNYSQDSFSDVALKRFDCGVQVGVDLEWKKLCFGLGGELGVINVMQENNSKAQTTNFTLSIGYKF